MFAGIMIFFLITSTFFLPYTSQDEQIRGVPEVDYPTYYVIPKTSFRCSDQLYNPGFYADTETRCQVFHYCYEHRQESFLCPLGTVFNQPILACDYWYSSNCSIAPFYYRVNADKRNENHFDEADDIIDSHSENLFDKMAHLYETNEAPEPYDLKNYSDTKENEFLDRDDVQSSGEPLTEKKDEIKDYNKYSYGDEFNMVDEKHPEVVQYEVRGLNTLNIHKSSENGQLYEKGNVNDFIFSEDGMLHQSQEAIQMYPTDMNFNQDTGYAEILGGENYSYDLNEGIDSERDSEIPDFLLQKRYTDLNGNYVRRPSSRRPVIVIPEEEPEIVQLPGVKHRRKPTGIASTAGKNEDTESFETNYDLTVFKEGTLSAISEGLENTTFGELSQDEPSTDLKDFELGDPKLFYKIQEKISDENGSQLPQTDGLNVIYDNSIKPETRNEFLPSNIEDEISGNHDYLGVSEVERGNTFINSNYGDDSNLFMGNAVSSTELPGEGFETASEDESSFDDDISLGSGLEDINLSHLNDGFSFQEDKDIFTDSEDREIADTEVSYLSAMNISDNFDGSGISFQENVKMSNFNEEVNDPIQFVLRKDSADSINYGKKSFFSLGESENFLPSENSDNNEGLELEPEGSGESNEYNYLFHESQDFSDNPQDASNKIEPEIQEIDGSYYYVFSESESNNEYEDSSETYPQNVDYTVAENFEGVSDKTTEEMIDIEGSRYATGDSKLKIDNVGNGALQTLDYQDSRDWENENLVDEFEMETSSDIPENNTTDDFDNDRELSTEDLKYLEIMSQNQSPILKNLFEVSYEKQSSDIKEIPSMEISPEKDANEQVDIYEDPSSLEDVSEFEKLDSDTSSAVEQYLTDIQDLGDDSEILNAEYIVEGISNEDGSGENGSELFSKQKLDVIIPVKETDPFNPLFAEGDKIILNDPGSKQISPKVPPVQPKIPSPLVMGENTNKVSRGKRFNENLRTFKPPNKGNSLAGQSKETFREAMFSSIPSTFLKMKHSYLRPYFYNYGLRDPGFNPRTGDSLESSKFSKLTTLGKRLLAAKSAKFNRMKKFIDSY